MGFIDKIKNIFNIGGVKVELVIDANLPKNKNEASGELVLTSKSDKHIDKIEVKLEEAYTKGSGENQKVEYFDLGKVSVPGGFDLKTGETKKVPFKLPYKVHTTDAESLQEMGGAMGVLGKLGSMVNKEKHEYNVVATVNVKGTTFSPSDRKSVKLV